MERICNFDLTHVIATLDATYPGDERKTGAHRPQEIVHQLRQCQHLLRMTSQGLAMSFNAYG